MDTSTKTSEAIAPEFVAKNKSNRLYQTQTHNSNKSLDNVDETSDAKERRTWEKITPQHLSSDVWKYFRIYAHGRMPHVAICNFCDSEILMGKTKSTSSMRAHLKSRHPNSVSSTIHSRTNSNDPMPLGKRQNVMILSMLKWAIYTYQPIDIFGTQYFKDMIRSISRTAAVPDKDSLQLHLHVLDTYLTNRVNNDILHTIGLIQHDGTFAVDNHESNGNARASPRHELPSPLKLLPFALSVDSWMDCDTCTSHHCYGIQYIDENWECKQYHIGSISHFGLGSLGKSLELSTSSPSHIGGGSGDDILTGEVMDASHQASFPGNDGNLNNRSDDYMAPLDPKLNELLISRGLYWQDDYRREVSTISSEETHRNQNCELSCLVASPTRMKPISDNSSSTRARNASKTVLETDCPAVSTTPDTTQADQIEQTAENQVPFAHHYGCFAELLENIIHPVLDVHGEKLHMMLNRVMSTTVLLNYISSIRPDRKVQFRSAPGPMGYNIISNIDNENASSDANVHLSLGTGFRSMLSSTADKLPLDLTQLSHIGSGAHPTSIEYINECAYNILSNVHLNECTWWMVWLICDSFIHYRQNIVSKFKNFQMQVTLSEDDWEMMGHITLLIKPFMIAQQFFEEEKNCACSYLPLLLSKIHRSLRVNAQKSCDYGADVPSSKGSCENDTGGVNDGGNSRLEVGGHVPNPEWKQQAQQLLDRFEDVFVTKMSDRDSTTCNDTEVQSSNHPNANPNASAKASSNIVTGSVSWTLPPLMLMATALDIRTKYLNGLCVEQVSGVWKHISERCLELVLNASENRDNSCTTTVDDCIDAFKSEILSFSTVTQLKHSPEEPQNPLLWWRDNEHKFPYLACIARQVLCIQPTRMRLKDIYTISGVVARRRRSGHLKSEWDVAKYTNINENWESCIGNEELSQQQFDSINDESVYDTNKLSSNSITNSYDHCPVAVGPTMGSNDDEMDNDVLTGKREKEMSLIINMCNQTNNGNPDVGVNKSRLNPALGSGDNPKKKYRQTQKPSSCHPDSSEPPSLTAVDEFQYPIPPTATAGMNNASITVGNSRDVNLTTMQSLLSNIGNYQP